MTDSKVGEQSEILSKDLFGDDFKWGVSVAAYQIEGAHDTEGKGKSIWDVFTSVKGRIREKHTGEVACDFYNRYKEDIDLVKKMNIPNFRFSISWARILPEGEGEINSKGIDFYNRVINYCLEQNVVPWITLYHWDLPHALEIRGGWTNREIIKWFSDYTKICATHFGDRVKHWIVMNEPSVFVGAGYFLGIHAPGRRGMKNFLPAIHHSVLCMAEGGRIVKNIVPDAEVGTTFSCSYIESYSNRLKDVEAAKKVDTLLNRVFIEPVLGLGYPLKDLPILKELNKYIQPGDELKMLFDFDFIGIQNYTREIVKHSYFTPYLSASLVSAEKRNVPSTLMKWEVYPQSIYRMIEKYSYYPQIRKLYITENGAAFKDLVEDNKVDDPLRVKYLQDHISQVLKAKLDGYAVDGYFVWTLTD
ncbi:MAG: family 1 glycosylhydrolase, partial [Pyrinomonadaceae bacterium]|nr:family 1 glycosylhydrolase [Sphingobacteriaceae bacterium]